MAADFTAVVVAGVTVVGTLGGTLLTQRMSIYDKKAEIEGRLAEAEIQRQAAAEEREAAARSLDLAARTALCAEINMAAQAYGARCRDVVNALAERYLPTQSGSQSLLEEAKSARVAFRATYGQAQMVLSERTLDLIAIVADCLGHAYGRMLESTEQNTDEAAEWIDGPCTEARRLLRRALREELGIDKPSAELAAAFDALALVHESAHAVTPQEP